MPTPNTEVLDFLLTRRSRPAKTLTGPGPDREALKLMLRAAARTPDHGKLEPWRFIVLEEAALRRLAGAVETHGQSTGVDPEMITKAAAQFSDSPLAVVVVSAPVDSPKIPRVEQTLSSGAVCLALLNAALASGWGANWLSGWASHDEDFCRDHLNLADGETVAGIIHIGTETSPPPERPRPDLSRIVTWVEA